MINALVEILIRPVVSAIDPRVRHILSWKNNFPSYADSRGASCQLLAKEWALNTDKLSPGGLLRNRVVK